MSELNLPINFSFQDIKKEPLSEEELEQLHKMSGSYEALLNKRAKLYQERDLKYKNLSEEEKKDLILEHYTFLKRPVIVNNNDLFIGNSAKTVAAAKQSVTDN